MKKLLFLVALVFLLASCKKSISELPAATATGANTFGASVNGKLWAPHDFGIVPTAPILEARYALNDVIINARNFASSPKESEFEIYIKNIGAPGVYLLNAETGSYAYYVERKVTPTGEWKTNSQYTGRVNITVRDTVNHILAGTFEFQAGSLYGEAPITVTDGRFDLKIN